MPVRPRSRAGSGATTSRTRLERRGVADPIHPTGDMCVVATLDVGTPGGVASQRGENTRDAMVRAGTPLVRASALHAVSTTPAPPRVWKPLGLNP